MCRFVMIINHYILCVKNYHKGTAGVAVQFVNAAWNAATVIYILIERCPSNCADFHFASFNSLRN